VRLKNSFAAAFFAIPAFFPLSFRLARAPRHGEGKYDKVASLLKDRLKKKTGPVKTYIPVS
jgi:hypothetical protein